MLNTFYYANFNFALTILKITTKPLWSPCSVVAFSMKGGEKLRIKKVDEKPMVIHTKEKPKIHVHESKDAKIKGGNVYTVEHVPGRKAKSDKQVSTGNGGKE